MKASLVPAARDSTLGGFPHTCWPIHQSFLCLTPADGSCGARDDVGWQADEGGDGVRVDRPQCYQPLGKKDQKLELPQEGPVLGTGSNHSPTSRRTDFRVQAMVCHAQELRCPFLEAEKHQEAELFFWDRISHRPLWLPRRKCFLTLKALQWWNQQ